MMVPQSDGMETKMIQGKLINTEAAPQTWTP